MASDRYIVAPKVAPELNIPSSSSIVNVSIIDRYVHTTCSILRDPYFKTNFLSQYYTYHLPHGHDGAT